MAGRDAENLGHYAYARLYEKTFAQRKQDIEFYLRLAERCAPASILEYGAGAGRVTLPLIRQGHRVTAIDASREMLALLDQKAQRLPQHARERLSLLPGDMRKKRLRTRFPLVLATFNVVAHLPHFQDMAAFLRRVKEHLSHDGLLVFDVSIPHPEEVEADPEALHPAARFKHPETSEWIRQTERFEYDPSSQTLLVESKLRSEQGGDELVIPLYLRQWFPREVDAILRYEGFTSIETYADFSESPGVFATDSLVFCASARKPRGMRKSQSQVPAQSLPRV